MYKVGFIGLGNMGYAILKGLLRTDSKDNFTFTEISDERKSALSKELNVKYSNNNIELVKNSKYIVLAVKPQVYKEVMEEIKEYLTPENIIITIAPGFDTNTVKLLLGSNVRVVRSMPNTPALVGEGMSAVCFSGDKFEDREIEDIKNIFLSFGEIEILEEKLMDAIVPISGSSPAYIYMLIEAMADGGVLMGLPRKLAYKLASQSVLGSAKMVLETNTHPGELKDAVCSPGGTTIEAVATLEKYNFRSSIIEAMTSAYNKAKNMK